MAHVSISSNDFRSGVFIEVDGAPYRVLGTPASFRARLLARLGAPLGLTLARRAPACQAWQGRRLCADEAEEPGYRRALDRAREHSRRGAGALWLSAYLKSARHPGAGNTVEKTFRAGEKARLRVHALAAPV